jgi:hypothetical protein
MCLLCCLQKPISRSHQVKQFLPSLIAKHAIPELSSEIVFLRARALDIF